LSALCKSCIGRRRVQHPDWTDYWGQIADKKLALDDVKGCINFFTTRGHKTIPDTMIDCEQCEGTGLQLNKLAPPVPEIELPG